MRTIRILTTTLIEAREDATESELDNEHGKGNWEWVAEDRATRVGSGVRNTTEIRLLSDVEPGTLFNLGDSTYLKLRSTYFGQNAVYVGTNAKVQPPIEPGTLVDLPVAVPTTPPAIRFVHNCRN